MIYEGKINYRLRKICCIVAGIVTSLIFRELFIILITMIFYMDILLSEKLSNAVLKNNEVIIKKHYLFGLIRKELSFNLLDPQRTLNSVFDSIPKDSKTFSIESLNKISKSKIIFYFTNEN